MNKYRAIKIKVDGILFDSKKEAERYRELKLLEKAGKIKDLALQPNFLLQDKYEKNGKTVKKIRYVADFCYWDVEKKKMVIEDVKGVKTAVYRLKKKIFEFRYPDYEITEL